MLARAARGLSSAGRHFGCAVPRPACFAPLLRSQQLHATTPAYVQEWKEEQMRQSLKTHDQPKHPIATYKGRDGPLQHDALVEFVDPYEYFGGEEGNYGAPGVALALPMARGFAA